MSGDDQSIPAGELSRRAFIRKCFAAGFAVPVIVSFTLDGVAGAVDAPPPQSRANQGLARACEQNPANPICNPSD